MAENKTLWQGRFEESLDAEAIAFETSIHVDARLAFDDIKGSIAHVSMLGDAGIIPIEDSKKIVQELNNIFAELEDGSLVIDTTAEDIHSFIEGVLTERLGEVGKKVHAGRSRNDQIALDERLYLRHAIPALQVRILTLIETLNDIASSHTETLMPGYTHLQRAQPVTLAHHLCAWSWMVKRDYERLQDSLKRIDFSPLGAGALAGSGLPLDRHAVAHSLGFSEVTPNSMDTVADRDYLIEMTAAFSLLMTHLSRFCEEIIIWATEEFKFIELSDKWSTGSSIMPQKKNPDFAELIRGRTGKVYGNLIALLTMMKALPLTYNRDLQEDKESFFAAYDTAYSCTEIFTRMIATTKWNTEKMYQSCIGGFANATDLADYLVKKGMPFRSAHEVVAGAVKICIEKRINLEDLSLDTYITLSNLITDDVYDYIKIEACVAHKNTFGGPASECVKKQIATLKDFCTYELDFANTHGLRSEKK